MNMKTGFSLQVELIRQMQAENGQIVCYATPASVRCTKRQSECAWRHDCFLDAEEPDAGWHDADVEATGQSWFARLD